MFYKQLVKIQSTNLTVKNDKGNIVGSISIKELLNGIKRPVSKSKKSYT